MKWSTEVRAVVVLVVVGVAIAGLFQWFPNVGSDGVALPAPTSQQLPVGAPTTTSSMPSNEELAAQLCGKAEEVATTIEPVRDNLVVVARVADPFLQEAVELTRSNIDIQAEFKAAADFYADYNEIGAPFDYDTRRIIADGDGRRWEALNTGNPTGVDAVRQTLAFVCGVELPPPPSIDPEEFEDIRCELDEDQCPLPPATVPPPAPPSSTAAAPPTTNPPTTNPPVSDAEG